MFAQTYKPNVFGLDLKGTLSLTCSLRVICIFEKAQSLFFQLLYRDGIAQSCPEGTRWIRIEGCEDFNLTQVSVGPSGLLWAIQWDGTPLVRIGITHENPIGVYLLHFFFPYV